MAKAKTTSTPTNTTKRQYELMFILEPGMPEKRREDVLNDIRKALKENDSAVTMEDLTWGERILMYRIAGHDYGYYGVFYFDGNPGHIKDIERAMQLEHAVVRCLITSLPADYKKVKYAEVKEHYDIVPKIEKKTPVSSYAKPVAPASKPKPVKDKKLEDILEEEI